MSSKALDHRNPEDLRRAYERHETIKEASQEFSVSYDTVRRWMIQHGIHTPCAGSRYGNAHSDGGGLQGRLPAHSDEPEIFELCWRLYRQGETDLLEAGVAPSTIAEELDTTERVVRGVLRALQEQGVVVERHGLNPETRGARVSFAPTALVENNGGEQR